MGIRINSNIPSLVALRNLALTEARGQRTLERLSTGERINRSSDDPSGLSLSESLRAQLRALRQTSLNARSARDLINTADAAMGEVSQLLIDLRRSLLFAMDGGHSTEQLAAEQAQVDSTLESLRRIAKSTRFADVPLLDGSAGFIVSGVSLSGLLEVKVFSARLNPIVNSTPFDVTVNQVATQATALAGSSAAAASVAASGGPVLLRLSGPLGTVDISLAAGATSADLQSAVNSTRGVTGVYASGGLLFTTDFGSQATLRLEQVGGTGSFRGGDPSAPGFGGVGSTFFTRGINAVITMNSQTLSGVGNTVRVNSPFFTGELVLNPATNQDPIRGPGTTGTFGFALRRSGLTFQFGTDTSAVNQPTLGIPGVAPEDLGRASVIIGGQLMGGGLSTLFTGAGNDLLTNPGNALAILDDAMEGVSQARAVAGSFVANVVDPTERTQAVTAENLQAADADLRDADVASEAAELARYKVLFQAGISVLAQANSLPESILQLLR